MRALSAVAARSAVPNVNFDFFPYCGIHRPVSLLVLPCRASIERIVVATALPADGDGPAMVYVRGTVVVSGPCEMRLSLAREPAVSPVTVAVAPPGPDSRATCAFEARLEIPPAHLRVWDLGRGELYELASELVESGSGDRLDECATTFGVREVRLERGELRLNGRVVRLRGFGKHEDFPVLGKGLSHAVNVRDAELLRWVGANSIRTTHYPYSEEVLELCDAHGMLVIDECPAVSLNFGHTSDGGARLLRTHELTLREMIERDVNHPCVVAWCTANEPLSCAPNPLADRHFEAVSASARRAERALLPRDAGGGGSVVPGRPLFFVSCHLPSDDAARHCDILGMNAYPGWYSHFGEIERGVDFFRGLLRATRAAHPATPLVLTEFGADAVAGLHSCPALMFTEEYQVEVIMAIIGVLHEPEFEPWVIGEHVWNFADFATTANTMRVVGNRKGVFTRDRQPKMAATALRMRWGPAAASETR